MPTYYAAIKYALDDPPDRKVAALRNGLAEVAMQLVEEFGQTADDVERWLEEAIDCARDAEASMEP